MNRNTLINELAEYQIAKKARIWLGRLLRRRKMKPTHLRRPGLGEAEETY